MRTLFGTDGIRGVAGDPPLDHKTVVAVGAALGWYLLRQKPKARVVIGQDTRESSSWIAAALVWGLAWAGVEAESAGVITTPATAPRAALKANESRIIFLTLMPTRLAAIGLKEQALMALPTIVFPKKNAMKATTAMAVPNTQKVWGMIVAPPMRIGLPETKGGRA